MAQSGGGASPRWSGLLLYNLTLVLSVVDALEALSFSQVFFSCSEGETHLLRNLLTSMVCTHGDEWELHPLEGRKTPPMQTLETPCHLTLHTPAVHARGFGGASPIGNCHKEPIPHLLVVACGSGVLWLIHLSCSALTYPFCPSALKRGRWEAKAHEFGRTRTYKT